MRQFSEFEAATRGERLLSNFLIFLFGCGVLAFFVAIDRVDWLSIRPATGTSIAMSNSASTASEPDMAEVAQAATPASR